MVNLLCREQATAACKLVTAASQVDALLVKQLTNGVVYSSKDVIACLVTWTSMPTHTVAKHSRGRLLTYCLAAVTYGVTNIVSQTVACI